MGIRILSYNNVELKKKKKHLKSLTAEQGHVKYKWQGIQLRKVLSVTLPKRRALETAP